MDQSQTVDRFARGLTTGFAALSQLAASVVGITAVLYVIGDIWSRLYYSHLGVGWVASMLNPQQVMAQPGLLLVSFLPINTIMIWSFQLQKVLGSAYGPSNDRIAKIAPWAVSVVPIIGMAVRLFTEPGKESIASLMLVLIIGLLASLVTWYVLDRFANSPFKRRDPGLMVAVPLGLLLWFAAFPIAGAYAENQLDEASTSYTQVELTGSEEAWRLVGPVGERLLIVSAEEKGNARAFRLVDPGSISRIIPLDGQKTPTRP